MTKGYYFNYLNIFHITQPDEVTARGLGGVAGVIQRVRGGVSGIPGLNHLRLNSLIRARYCDLASVFGM